MWPILKWLLFRLDAEVAHRWTVTVLRFLGRGAPWILRLISGGRANGPRVNFCGMEFLSPVGLAAGFDKDAELLEALPHLGFGFVEVGTVTPRPQPGNPKPRLFRDSRRQLVFNRMGFNNHGAAAAATRVAAARKTGRLPEGFRIGVNVGKNKDTPQEQAAQDYAAALGPFKGLVDFVVVNVSSPNTPGLRDLQSAEALMPIVQASVKAVEDWRPRPPVLVKLAPEVRGAALADSLSASEKAGASGFVLTNTLQGEWPGQPVGGFSGAPLQQMARESLKEARAATRLPIVS
ncbi:MAG TPA: quinone-dependent dihydroorotate dehydrogenase, partial [Bdellovibrionota bacterium]|nr:quinone-dependent dihydroorotate dehydrogenase [Bdellovibrionota bacterium]